MVSFSCFMIPLPILLATLLSLATMLLNVMSIIAAEEAPTQPRFSVATKISLSLPALPHQLNSCKGLDTVSNQRPLF